MTSSTPNNGMRDLLAPFAQGPGKQGKTFSDSHALAFGFWALKSSVIEDPHTVSSLFGGVCPYLSCLFPASQHFTVSPRLFIRAGIEDLSALDQDEGGAAGPGALIPGFTVVKYVGAGTDRCIQQPLVLWAVSRQREEPVPWKIYFEEYMQRLATHPPPGTDMRKVVGVLQVGSFIELYRIETVGDSGPLVVIPVGNMDILDPAQQGRADCDELTLQLIRCAQDNWAIE